MVRIGATTRADIHGKGQKQDTAHGLTAFIFATAVASLRFADLVTSRDSPPSAAHCGANARNCANTPRRRRPQSSLLHLHDKIYDTTALLAQLDRGGNNW